MNTPQRKKQTLQTMTKSVYDALAIAREHGLEAEVIASAMKEISEDVNIDVDAALQRGIEEWIK